jgi:hypothetical protein
MTTAIDLFASHRRMKHLYTLLAGISYLSRQLQFQYTLEITNRSL